MSISVEKRGELTWLRSEVAKRGKFCLPRDAHNEREEILKILDQRLVELSDHIKKCGL
jgi:hypothetical protein